MQLRIVSPRAGSRKLSPRGAGGEGEFVKGFVEEEVVKGLLGLGEGVGVGLVTVIPTSSLATGSSVSGFASRGSNSERSASVEIPSQTVQGDRGKGDLKE